MRRMVVVALALTACGTPAPEEECPPMPTACTPEYEPTFANIHARTVTGSCATGGLSCHGSVDASGGFSFATSSEAHSALSLLADGGACSPLWARLTSEDPAAQMPPGLPLDDGELCAIAQWIEAGTPQ